MNVHLHNVNLNSSSGPNSFGQKLIKYMSELGVEFDRRGSADANLCFISSPRDYSRLFQRLDGIYFNTDFDYDSQNTPILNTYKNAYGAIFQSNFNKRLVTSFFGKHSHSVVIHNGADLDTISNVQPAEISCEGDVWCCCSSWRPHKRLDENVRYFLEHSSSGDLLVVAGNTDNKVDDSRIIYVGNRSQNELYSIYKSSKYFLHLAWLDHCPNVVCDARGCGCQIICSSSGGTQEIAGDDAIIIEEDEWDFKPVKLYNPPALDFSRKIINKNSLSSNDMSHVAKLYTDFMRL